MKNLNDIINSEINRNGPISFKRFTELALYHKEFGYYSSGKTKIGKDGDFYTSPCVHSGFGEVICNFIVKSYKTFKLSGFNIIELGAGKGYLALDILNNLHDKYPKIYNDINYKILEVNKSYIEEGKKLLKPHSTRIKYYNSLKSLKNKKIKGVVISNEFFDSFPFHRLKFSNNEYYEAFVVSKKNNFDDIYLPLKNRQLATYIKDLDIKFEEGQEFEINLEARNWLDTINFILEKGLVLTIDYGYLADELYAPHRNRGTYKCFYKHNLNSKPYTNIGEQDITADVNFSDLIEYGSQIGLSTLKYTTQGQFLIDWGILKILEKYTDIKHEKERLALKNLFMPNLMGNRFKVLIQSKKIKSEELENFYENGEIKLNIKTL
ncbi:MAG: hypothetical protein GTO02_20125 [Candidatus Dadabacteria bacterium]|nr:hypothetical protein [Candidatus Dadabacteria bacterium]NIQ16605.1 hypothetical protein [Candidatus Dadabacteria bacterium]